MNKEHSKLEIGITGRPDVITNDCVKNLLNVNDNYTADLFNLCFAGSSIPKIWI